MKNVWIILLSLLIFLLLWKGFSQGNEQLSFILPSPMQVLERLQEKSDRFSFHTWLTVKEMLVGFLLASMMAFPLAWLMDYSYPVRFLLQPLFVIIQCIPMFTLAPLMVIWFGWTFKAIIIPTALMIFFPLTLSIYQGLRTTPAELLDYFRVNQATTWQIFFKLKLPWALPHVFSGFRLAAAIAGIAAIAGEWAGAQAGLGVLMVESRRDIDLETHFGALFCLILVSYLLYLFILGLEFLFLQRKNIRQFKQKIWKTKPLLAVSSFILFILVALNGCQSAITTSHPLRLTLDWLPNPNHVPLYVGIRKGFFSAQGIDLTLQKLRDFGHSTSYLTTQQCELALSYMPHTIRLQEKGGQVIPIAILIQEPLNALIYRTDRSISTLQDLSGKTFGYSNGGKETLFLDTLLANHHIAPKNKLLVGFDLVSSLATQQVDVLYGACWNIETEHLKFLGIDTRFFKLKELGVPHYDELIILARPDSPQADPQFIHRFQKALQQSIEYSRQYPVEAFDIYISYQLDKSEQTKAWERKAWNRTLPALADRQEIDPKVWKRFHDWLQEHHLL
jgi:NitT/TauT family transport system substrate-binding protein